LELAVALSPDDPTIYEHLGDAYVQNNDILKARNAYMKSIEQYDEKEKKEGVRRKLEALISKDGHTGGAK